MINYARSGGTLLNKCLASFPDVVMLSEVNPIGGGWGILQEKSPTTIKSQASEWYGINIENDGFREGIIELATDCEKNNRHLIIRDWSFINFSNHKDNKNNPIGKLLTLEELNGLDLKPFLFVRDAIDVWISRGMPDISNFASGYLNFLDEALKPDIPVFKYEDFVRDPEKLLKEICSYTGINYSSVYPECLNYSKVNGDTQFKKGSRRINQLEIKQFPRKKIPFNKIFEVNDSMIIKKANKMMGYPEGYFQNDSVDKLIFKMNYFLPKVFNFLNRVL